MTVCIDDSSGQLHSFLQNGYAIFFQNCSIVFGAQLVCAYVVFPQIKFLEVVCKLLKILIYTSLNFPPETLCQFICPPVGYDSAYFLSLISTRGYPFFLSFSFNSQNNNAHTKKEKLKNKPIMKNYAEKKKDKISFFLCISFPDPPIQFL